MMIHMLCLNLCLSWSYVFFCCLDIIIVLWAVLGCVLNRMLGFYVGIGYVVCLFEDIVLSAQFGLCNHLSKFRGGGSMPLVFAVKCIETRTTFFSSVAAAMPAFLANCMAKCRP